MSKWTPARIELAKQCYGRWHSLPPKSEDAHWLQINGLAYWQKWQGREQIRLNAAGRDALDREIGGTG